MLRVDFVRRYAHSRFSLRKAANVLHGAMGFDALLAKLGRHTTARDASTSRSLRITDIDVKVLETLVGNAVAATRVRRSKQT
jgi:hypothetical protein